MRFLLTLIAIGGAFITGGALGLTHGPFRLALQQPNVETSATPAPAVVATTPPNGAPTPAATAAPLYRFVYTPTPSPAVTPFAGPRAPKILEIDLSDQTLLTPGDLRVRVLTSIDVSAVTAKAWGYELAIPRVADGTFSAQYSVPQAPAFVRGRTFAVDFVAAVPDGRISTVTLQLGLK